MDLKAIVHFLDGLTFGQDQLVVCCSFCLTRFRRGATVHGLGPAVHLLEIHPDRFCAKQLDGNGH